MEKVKGQWHPQPSLESLNLGKLFKAVTTIDNDSGEASFLPFAWTDDGMGPRCLESHGS